MRVFLAGGTGAIGRRLVPQLVARGHEVTATTRDPDKVEILFTLGATPVLMDGLDGAAVGEAVAKAQPEAIIHEMTALTGTPDFKHFDRWFAQTNRLRTEGTEHLLAAAKASWCAPVRGAELHRLDQCPLGRSDQDRGRSIRSAPGAGAAGDAGGDPIRRGGGDIGAARRDRPAVRQPVRAGASRRWSRSSAAARCRSSAMARRCGRGSMSTMRRQRQLWRWKGAQCGIFNIVDDEPAAVAEWLPYLAEAVGARRPMRVPVWIARFAIGDAGVRMMTEGRGSSNEKARRELGWCPIWSSWREGFRHGLLDSQSTELTDADRLLAAA